MKLLSLQFAIFSSDPITRPDVLYGEVNNKLGSIINDMPTILNIPSEIPADVPLVQAKSLDGNYAINVSRSRIDLFINFKYADESSPQDAFASKKDILTKYHQAVTESISAYRTGLILTLFEPQTNNVKAVFDKYISEKYVSKYIEAAIRTNKQSMRKNMVYNNIRSITAGSVSTEGETYYGVIIQEDINNVPEEGKNIGKDIFSFVISQAAAVAAPDSIKELI